MSQSAISTTFNDAAIWTRIRCVWWLVKEDLAIHKFGSLLELELDAQDLTAPKSYRSDETAWDITVILAKYFRRLLKERLQKSPYFGIMVDETTDNSVNQQLILYIKSLQLNSNGELETIVEYLDLISPKSGSAEDLTVLDSL